jgi:uncharacterized protein (DUF1499 family)
LVRYYQHISQKAEWSARIGVLFFVLFLLTFGAHRFGKLSTPAAMQLFGAAVAGAVLAVGLGVAAFVSIWRDGHLGITNASIGVLFGMVMLIGPILSLPSLLKLPRIYEVSTDMVHAPLFEEKGDLAKERHHRDKSFRHETALLQVKAYPDIKPLIVNRSREDAYSAVLETVQKLKWKISLQNAPTQNESGKIEATDHTMIFGFIDDVVIRVAGNSREAQVDVRSSSRYGQHDLGRNAARVEKLFTEVKHHLDQIDKNERMERAVALHEQRVKKALAEKEAAAKEKARQEKAAQRAAARARANSEQAAAGQNNAQSHSRQETQDGRAQNRRQRERDDWGGFGRFWE